MSPVHQSHDYKGPGQVMDYRLPSGTQALHLSLLLKTGQNGRVGELKIFLGNLYPPGMRLLEKSRQAGRGAW